MKLQYKELKHSLKQFIYLYIRLHKHHKNQEQGYVLFMVMGALFVMNALLMAYMLMAKIENTTAVASADSNTGFYGAEAGLNLRAESIRTRFENFGQPSGTSPSSVGACIDSYTSNNGTGDFACQTHTLGASSLHTTNSYITESPNNPRQIVIPRGDLFQNLNAQEYGYSIISETTKANDLRQEARLAMNIRSRVVPLFQFAAFYQNDLEILPGPPMTLNGPVHTNGNLYLGGDNSLQITGQVTTIGDVFNSRKSNGATYPTGRVQVANTAGTLTNLLLANANVETAAALSRTNLTNLWGNQIRTGAQSIQVPAPSFLDRTGQFFANADLRIQYNPTPTPPTVAVTAIKRNQAGQPTTVLSEGQIRSLRQPVMTTVCSPVPSEYIPSPALTAAQKDAVIRALQVSIASANNLVSLSTIQASTNLNTLNGGSLTPASGAQNLQQNVIARLQATGLSSAAASNLWNNPIRSMFPTQVAALKVTATSPTRCFKAAPIIIDTTGFNNNRESDRIIQLVHVNIESLTAWNRDGIYVTMASGAVTNHNSNTGFDFRNDDNFGLPADAPILFDLAATDASAATNSFQRLGYAAVDETNWGLLFHLTVDPNAPNVGGNQSPYGFAITNGTQLPGLARTTNVTNPTGLTIVSDQAIYLQGDYNCRVYSSCNGRNSDIDNDTINDDLDNNIPNATKQPAAILADSLNVLSSNCIDTNMVVNCGINNTQPAARDTEVNTAFLAGTDITIGAAYNGGLENYPRFHENWQPNTCTSNRCTLRYRGSFISLGTAQRVNGTWANQVYNAPGRDWNYDLSFNTFNNLPPMTPNLVYLRQDLFLRNFDQ